MKRKLIADSSVDLFALGELNFTSVPLTIATDERSFTDDEALDVTQMLDYMAGYNRRSYTACPNVEAWLQAYQGAEEIFVVTLSSNISGTYGAAVTAAELYREECPDAKIHVFDTLSAGPEVRMLAKKLAEDIASELSFDEICQRGEAYMKQTAIFFCLQSFHNFAQNGRVNKTVAKLGGMLGIRIMATASDHGTIDVLDKCRGDKATIKKFLEKLEKSGYQGGKIAMAHCENLPFAEMLSQAVREVYPAADIEIYETRGLCSFYAERGGILLGFEKG
ncbi:MAG: DegV family protein [Oscillospiraceae bacterium]|nr:DegV family protein [Oscillospiraceae bacterium]